MQNVALCTCTALTWRVTIWFDYNQICVW
jgi:hypothetical protein